MSISTKIYSAIPSLNTAKTYAQKAYAAIPSLGAVKSGLKTIPSIIFEDGADIFVRGAKDNFKAGIKKNQSIKKALLDGIKKSGKNLAKEVAEKDKSGNFFKRFWKSIKSTPTDIATATKNGAKVAKEAGKSGIIGGAKGLGKGIWSKMPLVGNLLLIGFELPNIITATKEQGIGQGVAEVAKTTSRLVGGSIGAAIGGMAFGPIGGFIGYGVGEWLTSKIVGKSYSEKIAEAQEKQAEALSMLQQQPQTEIATAPQAPQYQYNPYGVGSMNDFLTNSMSNPYSNDLMMQNMNFNTIA